MHSDQQRRERPRASFIRQLVRVQEHGMAEVVVHLHRSLGLESNQGQRWRTKRLHRHNLVLLKDNLLTSKFPVVFEVGCSEILSCVGTDPAGDRFNFPNCFAQCVNVPVKSFGLCRNEVVSLDSNFQIR